MRKKYNVFKISKINKITISMALKLKEEMEKTKLFSEETRGISINAVPTDEDKFLKYLSCKYLNLKPEHGLPLLKQAYRQQYDIRDEYKECRRCGKIFRFDRKSKDFCSNRCRQRFYRDKRRGKKISTVTLRGVSNR